MKNFALGLLLALPVSGFAATVAVIDSGTDYQHKDLAAQYEINLDEIAGNKIDDEKNGYVDDVYGYDMFGKTPAVIDYSYLERLKPSMPDIHKFFEIQVRLMDKTATAEEIAWMKAKRADEKFIKELSVFGNFSHGTHVAGITAGHSTSVDKEIRPYAIKIIPTEVKLPGSKQYATSPDFQKIVTAGKIGIPAALRIPMLSLGLRYLAKFQTKVFGTVGKYVNGRHADIANGSFGTGMVQIRMVTEMLYNLAFKPHERDPKQVDELAREYMQQILINSRAMTTAAPNTLFVFAAGNDGTDNTVSPCSPANLREENSITVAATNRNRELAVFSNYGSMVDVAAPGVGISSLYPGSERGLMSGTSQAAPYVAGVAAMVKNENPNLKPSEIKEILKGTVDTKDWLIGKVLTSGVVNPNRAKEAGMLSKQMSVNAAVAASRAKVRDLDVEAAPTPAPGGIDASELAMVPLVSPID